MTLPHIFLEGHTWYWQSEEVGVVEKRLMEEHGNIVHWNGPLGVYLSQIRVQQDPYAHAII